MSNIIIYGFLYYVYKNKSRGGGHTHRPLLAPVTDVMKSKNVNYCIRIQILCVAREI